MVLSTRSVLFEIATSHYMHHLSFIFLGFFKAGIESQELGIPEIEETTNEGRRMTDQDVMTAAPPFFAPSLLLERRSDKLFGKVLHIIVHNHKGG